MRDYVVVLFVGRRNAQGCFKGWNKDVTVPANSAKEAIKIVSDMLSSDTHVFAKTKPRKKKEKPSA